MPASRLFVPYKTAGLVAGGEQCAVQTLGREAFLTTPVGRALLVYNLDHLSVALVSRQLPHDITCVRRRGGRAPAPRASPPRALRPPPPRFRDMGRASFWDRV